KKNTTIHIIYKEILCNTCIFTDEHKNRNYISKLGFTHKTACHKYNFLNLITDAYVPFIKSFNN
ncbi:hypothetical protein H311_00953, partial [Anncaliia algerae PRA109]